MTFETAAAGVVPPPRTPGQPYRIGLVCLGNICRSPMAEAILREDLVKAGLGEKVEVDSAGTGDWHLGETMDARAVAELTRRGYDGSGHESRQIEPSWLPGYDLLLAMDGANLADLRAMAQGDPDLAGRIQLLRWFDPQVNPGSRYAEVPDPYHGGPEDYAHVFDLVSVALDGLVSQLAERL